jgi:hypothetical protein
MTTWKGQAFEREWHRAILEWIDGGRVGEEPSWEVYNSRKLLWESADCGDLPSFVVECEYRWKPKPKRTVTINGKVLVAPEVDAPAFGSVYFFVALDNNASSMRWEGCEADKAWLDIGNIFLTREDAQNFADWLVKCKRGET